MLLLVSVALSAGVLLGCRRYGVRPLAPLAGVLSLAAGGMLDPAVGAAPLMGLIAGFQVERRRGYGWIIGTASLPGAVLSLWMLVARQGEGGEALVDELTRQLEAMGMQGGEEGYALREIVGAVLRIQPAIEFSTLLLALVLGYRLACWMGRYLQISLPSALPFHLWRPWEELIWGMIAALGMRLISSGFIGDLALNLLVVASVVYAVHGLAVVRFFLWKHRLSRLVELIFYVALFFSSGVGIVVLVGLGLLDTWFDWRHLRVAPLLPDEADEGDKA